MRLAQFPSEAVPSDLGKTVAQARTARRWSQARLAAKAKVARASIYRLEGGGRPVRPDTIFRVARALELDMRTLVPEWPEWDPLGPGGHGPRTRERRRALCLTAANLAAAAGVSEATLSRYERGIGFSPSLLKRVGDQHFASNESLARTLGFKDIPEFEGYCRSKQHFR